MEAQPSSYPAPAKYKVDVDAREYREGYREYNSVLRSWFIAFGIGGPALLLTQPDLLKTLTDQGAARGIALLFLLGVASQVLIALVNKLACWYCYVGRTVSGVVGERLYDFMRWMSYQMWVDVICDMISLVAFLLAIWQLFRALT
jgi:hypothetical protein